MSALCAVEQAVTVRQIAHVLNDLQREDLHAVSQLIPTKKLLNRQATRKGWRKLGEAPEVVSGLNMQSELDIGVSFKVCFRKY
jgi:hypothetical protein